MNDRFIWEFIENPDNSHRILIICDYYSSNLNEFHEVEMEGGGDEEQDEQEEEEERGKNQNSVVAERESSSTGRYR